MSGTQRTLLRLEVSVRIPGLAAPFDSMKAESLSLYGVRTNDMRKESEREGGRGEGDRRRGERGRRGR
jgi:hypothetical protein